MNNNLPTARLKLQQRKIVRFSIAVSGIVQGVGFRPFIYSLAKKYYLQGFVLNNTLGVKIEVEGEEEKIKSFLGEIKTSHPPLAVIQRIKYEKLAPLGYATFEIRKSRKEKGELVPISPDISICHDCLRELLDPEDRRFAYPFINCTNCGPRFTIIQDIPYDRSRTTMKVFRMCPDCQVEYEDPLNRRFHAQPNACPVCGPQVMLLDVEGRKAQVADPIKEVADLLKRGCVIAVKGLGGFHLACDATSPKAVATLRKRKYREDKPFALMALDVEMIRKFCQVNQDEKNLLFSSRRPIVLLRKKEETPSLAAEEIAPQSKFLGFMLPYTPLHYLLLKKINLPLVMTSGNVSDEPIVYGNEEALAKLGGIADYFLIHNRDIQMRCDDSVLRVFQGKELPFRRSRGYAPQPIKVKAFFDEPILAVGGQLKNTFCLARGDQVIISHHIGDLENLSALTSFEEGIKHFLKLFHTHPKILACDLHPDYLSTKFAEDYVKRLGREGALVRVQHHHAHIVSLMADRGIEGKVIGVSLDGAGMGDDERIWGGEFLVADYLSFTRLGHLKEVPLPGGEEAIKKPWRMALSHLKGAFGEDGLELALKHLKKVNPAKILGVDKLIEKRINSPLTSSVGRLFDAVSSLIGIRNEINYEGQAAMELEMACDDKEKKSYPFNILGEGEKFMVDSGPIIRSVVADLEKGERGGAIAAKFHNSLALIILQSCQLIRERTDLNRVALSGGVFQNMYLLQRVFPLLESANFRVYTHSRVPPNDGGISLGQAAVAHYGRKIKKEQKIKCA